MPKTVSRASTIPSFESSLVPSESVRVPWLQLIVGPNDAGKSSLFAFVIQPDQDFVFVNADVIAAQLWPDDTQVRAYDAAKVAAQRRGVLNTSRVSFVSVTVFSHPSKLEILTAAKRAGYFTTLHIVAVPEVLSVARVRERVRNGGHEVPEEKIRTRYHRLWPLVSEAISLADRSVVYDNSKATSPFRVVARYEGSDLLAGADWPNWLTFLPR